MSRHWRKGSTTAWRKVRALVLDRDGRMCRLRIADDCQTIANEVHHTRDPRLGDDPAYLIAACKPCNLLAGDPRRTDPQPRPRTQW